MLRRTMRKWLLLFALVLLVVGAGGRFWPRERLLLERATPVIKTEDFHLGERFNYGLDVHWLSNDEILFSRFEGPQKHDRVIYRRNVKTGHEQRLPELTKAIDELGGEVIDAENVSPDGRWLLRSARWQDCLLAEVDGLRHTIYPSITGDDYRSLIWTADSRYWLEIYVNGGTAHNVIWHDTQNPKLSRKLPFSGKEQYYGSIERILSSQQAVSIIRPENEEKPPKVTVSEMSLEGKVIREYPVAVPQGSNEFQTQVSPNGDRIAWQVTSYNLDTRPRWVQRFFPFVPRRNEDITELWISNLDGSDMRNLGHIITPRPETSEETIPYMDSLKWLPDGKSLSFEYKDQLWTVPAG